MRQIVHLKLSAGFPPEVQEAAVVREEAGRWSALLRVKGPEGAVEIALPWASCSDPNPAELPAGFGGFLRERWSEPDFRKLLDALRQLLKEHGMTPRPPRVPVLIFACLVLTAASGLTAGEPPAQTQAAADLSKATYAGSEACAACHDDVATRFGLSMHARLKEWELRGADSKCESCHGPGSLHIENSGDKSYIFGFKGEEGREASKSCLSCHYESHAAEWPGSTHFMAGLGCGDCHQIHQSRRAALPNTTQFVGARLRNPEMGMITMPKPAPPQAASLLKPEPEVCFDCHREKRAQVNYSSHHPVIEGRMGCSSCHSVHGSPEESLLKAPEGINEMCSSCHPAQQGPFVFEHAAVEEGCTTCHEPHGSVANNLLVQNEPFLCLQCHEAHFHIGRDGISDPISRPSGTTTNPFGSSGWRQAFTTKCTNCHPSVHGSDLPSQGITSHGGSLTR